VKLIHTIDESSTAMGGKETMTRQSSGLLQLVTGTSPAKATHVDTCRNNTHSNARGIVKAILFIQRFQQRDLLSLPKLHRFHSDFRPLAAPDQAHMQEISSQSIKREMLLRYESRITLLPPFVPNCIIVCHSGFSRYIT
jgi:hypothetical protein